MGRKDEVAKEYIGQPEIFADLFNQYCFHGEQVIRPERLRREDATEGAMPESKKKPVQQQRDLQETPERVSIGRSWISLANGKSRKKHAQCVCRG